MARSRITLDGLPHSEISGSKPVCGSPELIAAYHVLHRRPAPRHPPYALSSLTTTFILLETPCCFVSLVLCLLLNLPLLLQDLRLSMSRGIAFRFGGETRHRPAINDTVKLIARRWRRPFRGW